MIFAIIYMSVLVLFVWTIISLLLYTEYKRVYGKNLGLFKRLCVIGGPITIVIYACELLFYVFLYSLKILCKIILFFSLSVGLILQSLLNAPYWLCTGKIWLNYISINYWKELMLFTSLIDEPYFQRN